MDVAMGGVPKRMFVVHAVVTHAAVGREAPLVGEMFYPCLLIKRVGEEVRVGGVVGDNEPTLMSAGVGADAVASVCEPFPIVAGLRAVFSDRIAGEFSTARAKFGHPPNHRNCQHRFGAAVLAGSNMIVGGSTGRGGTCVETFE